MIRSMVLAPNLPFPTRGGPDLRAWQMVNALVALGPVGVFGLRHESSTRPPDDRIAMWRSGSDDRLLTTDSLHDLSWMAERDGLPSSRYYSERVASEISDSVRAFRPDVVVLEAIWMAPYLDVVSDVPSVVLDAHNVETALHREIAAAQTNPAARLLHTEFAKRLALPDVPTFGAVDQIWVWVGLGLLSVVGSALFGRVSDRVGKRMFVLITSAILVVCFLALSRGPSPVWLPRKWASPRSLYTRRSTEDVFSRPEWRTVFVSRLSGGVSTPSSPSAEPIGRASA